MKGGLGIHNNRGNNPVTLRQGYLSSNLRDRIFCIRVFGAGILLLALVSTSKSPATRYEAKYMWHM